MATLTSITNGALDLNSSALSGVFTAQRIAFGGFQDPSGIPRAPGTGEAGANGGRYFFTWQSSAARAAATASGWFTRNSPNQLQPGEQVILQRNDGLRWRAYFVAGISTGAAAGVTYWDIERTNAQGDNFNVFFNTNRGGGSLIRQTGEGVIVNNCLSFPNLDTTGGNFLALDTANGNKVFATTQAAAAGGVTDVDNIVGTLRTNTNYDFVTNMNATESIISIDVESGGTTTTETGVLAPGVTIAGRSFEYTGSQGSPTFDVWDRDDPYTRAERLSRTSLDIPNPQLLTFNSEDFLISNDLANATSGLNRAGTTFSILLAKPYLAREIQIGTTTAIEDFQILRFDSGNFSVDTDGAPVGTGTVTWDGFTVSSIDTTNVITAASETAKDLLFDTRHFTVTDEGNNQVRVIGNSATNSIIVQDNATTESNPVTTINFGTGLNVEPSTSSPTTASTVTITTDASVARVARFGITSLGVAIHGESPTAAAGSIATDTQGRMNWVLNHNLDTDLPIVQIYDSQNAPARAMIIPEEIQVTNDNTVTIVFDSSTLIQGYAVITG